MQHFIPVYIELNPNWIALNRFASELNSYYVPTANVIYVVLVSESNVGGCLCLCVCVVLSANTGQELSALAQGEHVQFLELTSCNYQSIMTF